VTEHKPSLGRIVHYTLSEQDADAINHFRENATAHLQHHRDRKDGSQVHIGNEVQAGEVYPMVITRVWGDTPSSAINGQVQLDGNDLYWATSVQCGDGPRTFAWPARI
jgi:hypothetical protein